MNPAARLILVVIAAVSIAALCGPPAEAAQLKVTNIVAIGGGQVQFDITWTDSWRASWTEAGTKLTNWDAAWIFVKYRKKGDAGWSHATLSAKDADHSAPKGAEIDVGLTAKLGMGVFLYRSAEGKGAWTNKGVKLKWMYKDDKVADPARVELFVHALEMVYVPKGSFYVGSAGKLAGSFTEGSWKRGDEVIPFKVTSEAELEIAPKPGCLYGTGGIGAAHQIGPAGKLSPKFPKGFRAFYCMKYEINQGEYAAFLDQLTAAQAAERYPFPTIPDRFSGNGVHTVRKTAKGFAASKPERSCNWVSWDDCAAYIDWAGLRPMTELEFEKSCRGPRKPVKNEYAWGTGEMIEAPWIFEPAPIPPVPLPQGICGKDGRVKAGCTYWGIAAMSGHLRERVVTAGHIEGRAYTAVCGDGVLTKDGLANVPNWPGPAETWPVSSTAGAGFSGGPWYNGKSTLRVSDRFLSSCLRKQRDRSYGFRGVRQAPQ
jgi:formylglycine-generating enzyme required for sulfatase activity